MKTFISLALVVIFSVSGCTDFIASSDLEESRASRPSPADISTKTVNYETGIGKIHQNQLQVCQVINKIVQ